MKCATRCSLRLLLTGSVLTMLAACGGGVSDGGERMGTLQLGVTDAPVDQAEAVVVQFTGIEHKPTGVAGGGADPIATAKVDAATHRYAIGFAPAGRYVVAYTCDADDSTVDADGAPTPPATGETETFTPPSGTAVDVAVNQTTTVDFAAAG